MQTVDHVTTSNAPRDDKAVSLAGSNRVGQRVSIIHEDDGGQTKLSRCVASIKYSHASCACRLSDMRLYKACIRAGLLSQCTHRIDQRCKALGTSAANLETGLPVSCGQLALALDLTGSSASGSTDLYHSAFGTYVVL